MQIKVARITTNRAYLIEQSLKMKKTRKINENKKNKNRKLSEFGTRDYNDSLQKAFNRVKQQVFFNPDMIYFVTLTYKGTEHTASDVLYDLRQLMKKTKRQGYNPKYVAVFEYQKRGSIHVHMITNDQFLMNKNKNNHLELTDWQKGYSSILTIDDVDKNFRPFLYLFKYMKKSARIGKRFVYSSRNLNNFIDLPPELFDYKLYNEIQTEKTHATLPTGKIVWYNKYYFELKKDGINELDIPDQFK